MTSHQNGKFGRFTDTLDLRVDVPPRNRKWWEFIFPRRPQLTVLSENFAYIDSDGEEWPAPKWTRTNGASSPWLLWRLMPPFDWRTIYAAVVHDPACVNRDRPSTETHRMLYFAMRCQGVSPLRAWGAWFLARCFGPRFPGESKGIKHA